MKIEIAYLHCGDYLLKTLKKEIEPEKYVIRR